MFRFLEVYSSIFKSWIETSGSASNRLTFYLHTFQKVMRKINCRENNITTFFRFLNRRFRFIYSGVYIYLFIFTYLSWEKKGAARFKSESSNNVVRYLSLTTFMSQLCNGSIPYNDMQAPVPKFPSSLWINLKNACMYDENFLKCLASWKNQVLI